MKASATVTVKDKGLLTSTAIVSSMTLISRVLGLIRDMVIGYAFGAVAGVDAYFVAAKIPNFLRRLFAEGSFSQAFVPVFADYQQHREHNEIRTFAQNTAGVLSIILFFIALLGMVGAPWLIRVFAPGFDSSGLRYEHAHDMLRITFPYIFFISLTAFSSAMLNSYGRFAVPAFTPVLLNVCIILCALFLAPYCKHGVYALAWGMCIAGVVQFLFQLPFVARINLLVWPKWGWHDPGVRRVITLMIPTLIGASVSQINLLMDTLFASFLPVGSVSWLYYSDRLTQFPLGVFGVAISTVILPYLSRQHSNEQQGAYAATMDWGLRTVLLIGLPASLGLFILSGPLLATLFQYGAFRGQDVMMASHSLMAFAFGLTAFMLVKVLVSGFFARKDTKTPVKVAFVIMLANTILNFILMWPLKHAGLALATSLAAWMHMSILIVILKRRDIYQAQAGWFKFLGQIVLANGLMVLITWYLCSDLQQWLDWHWQQRFAHLLGLMCIAIVTYFSVLRVCGIRLTDFVGKNKTI